MPPVSGDIDVGGSELRIATTSATLSQESMSTATRWRQGCVDISWSELLRRIADRGDTLTVHQRVPADLGSLRQVQVRAGAGQPDAER